MREEKTGKITGGIKLKNFVRRRTDSGNAVTAFPLNYYKCPFTSIDIPTSFPYFIFKINIWGALCYRTHLHMLSVGDALHRVIFTEQGLLIMENDNTKVMTR